MAGYNAPGSAPSAATGYTGDFEAMQNEILRRRRMAELLQQQSLQADEGPRVGRTSILSPIAKMVMAFAAKQGLDRASQDEGVLNEKKSAATDQGLSNLAEILKGTPEQPATPGVDLAQNNEGDEMHSGVMLPRPAIPAQAPTSSAMLQGMRNLLPLGPSATVLGEKMIGMETKRQQDEQARTENIADRQQRNAELVAQRTESAAQRSQDRQAAVAQRAEAERLRSEDRQLSVQQRADAARQHTQTMVELAKIRTQGGGNAGQAQGDYTKTGKDFLDTLDPSTAVLIPKIASGEIPLTSFSTRGGHREALATAVSAYDPSFNNTRPTVWRDFTSGPTGKNITSINTALAHMGTMKDLTDALANNDMQGANKVVNFISQQLGDPSVTNFQTARQAVGEELMRTFRVVGASEHEAQAWMDRFKDSNSPAQLNGALGTAAQLLGGRLKAVNDQWKRGTQSKEDFPNIVAPENLAVMKRLGASPSGGTSASTAPAPAAGLPKVSSQSDYDKLNNGDQYVAPDGSVRRKGK